METRDRVFSVRERSDCFGRDRIISCKSLVVYMATARCCPADCTLRSDWEDELRAEEEMLSGGSVSELLRYMKLLGHPLRLNIILMLLKRDHCVCEFFYVFREPQNLISYNLKKLKDGGIIESYYRSNHKIYKIREEIAPAIRKITTAMSD